MEIRELANITGVPPKTIRYYEQVGVLPPPARQSNGYRIYSTKDINRLNLVAGARQLNLSLDDIREIVALRDRNEAPCQVLLDRLAEKANEIASRIADLQRLEHELRELHAQGLTFPTDDVEGKECICHLVSKQAKLV